MKKQTFKVAVGAGVVIAVISSINFPPPKEVEAYNPPDSCELEVVICAGEVSEPIVWVGNEGVINAPKKKGASVEQQKLIDYAWFISGDKDFVYMIEGESGWVNKVSPPNSDGSRDHGLGQINDRWHKEIVNNPKFNDGYWQIDQAYKLYIGGTKFYGKSRIPVAKLNFND